MKRFLCIGLFVIQGVLGGCERRVPLGSTYELYVTTDDVAPVILGKHGTVVLPLNNSSTIGIGKLALVQSRVIGTIRDYGLGMDTKVFIFDTTSGAVVTESMESADAEWLRKHGFERLPTLIEAEEFGK